uniref:Chromo domain-containing protein n=1 Tax=Panagrolaimus sp. PS1159 TaxID=55785 RepID=A0AC35EUA6_9BILA
MVRKRLWEDNDENKKPKFKVGDKVRTLNYKQVFDTGYFPKFSDTIRTVHVVENRKFPITYRLIEDDGKQLKKQFYATELCKVKQDANSIYRIEIIAERINKKGEKEYFVKYLGYNESRWVNQSEMVNI